MCNECIENVLFPASNFWLLCFSGEVVVIARDHEAIAQVCITYDNTAINYVNN